jgi:hypothetical protein
MTPRAATLPPGVRSADEYAHFPGEVGEPALTTPQRPRIVIRNQVDYE